MQRYGDFGLIPNKQQHSFSTCCDQMAELRQYELAASICVAKVIYKVKIIPTALRDLVTQLTPKKHFSPKFRKTYCVFTDFFVLLQSIRLLFGL